jgi:AcrR family transcriptional regulator
MSIPTSTRDRLLSSALRIIARDGPGALTLAKVAAEAGVSKGGLLYHYPTKASLLRALIVDWLDQLERDADARGSGNWGRGYVRACDAAHHSAHDRETSAALLAAVAADPQHMSEVHTTWDRWQARLENESVERVDATVARLAADGLWLADLLGLAPPRGALRAAVVRRLVELADSGAPRLDH